jgi:hypothetical protein
MTHKQMRLFQSKSESISFLETNYSMTNVEATRYVDNHTIMKPDDKVWVVLP